MFDEARLERLIAAYLDQQLTGEERRELEEMLLASSKARELFLDRVEWHGLLREQALQDHANLLTIRPKPSRKTVPFRRRAWLAAAIAACVALGWWKLPRAGKDSPPSAMHGPVAAHDRVALLAQAIEQVKNS